MIIESVIVAFLFKKYIYSHSDYQRFNCERINFQRIKPFFFKVLSYLKSTLKDQMVVCSHFKKVYLLVTPATYEYK